MHAWLGNKNPNQVTVPFDFVLLCVCLFVCLFVCLCVCVFVCLFLLFLIIKSSPIWTKNVVTKYAIISGLIKYAITSDVIKYATTNFVIKYAIDDNVINKLNNNFAWFQTHLWHCDTHASMKKIIQWTSWKWSCGECHRWLRKWWTRSCG